MLHFSSDAQQAEKQMRAVIFYLTTFGYIDGDFDSQEKAFVRNYIERLVVGRVEQAVSDDEVELRAELVRKYTTHFHEVFEEVDGQIQEYFNEPVADGEDRNAFAFAKLKLRCFEIFQSFEEADRHQLLDTVDELIQADGQVHPAELKFRGELGALLSADLDVELVEEEEEGERRSVMMMPAREVQLADKDHPFFGRLEWDYDPTRLLDQFQTDLDLVAKALKVFEERRAAGNGKLAGHKNVLEFRGQEPFLDGHVHVLPQRPGETLELTVLGDLHGCYGCLKAAITQSQFFEKVNAYVADPEKNPNPKLVLLGDYVDRGIYSYQGVLRAVMQVLVAAPDHVYMLRGNHEYYFEHQGTIYGGVKPAEAINRMKPYLPTDIFKRYLRLFDELPNMLLADRFLFVHGGIPRDALLKERWKDLSSLNDSDLRFQMMWSDPSTADVIPAQLQQQSARFPFGRLQSLAFLQRIGCHTLVRGHEKFDEGFRRIYDDADQLLISLFSAGGKNNFDLPPDSSYRTVTPMAMTVRIEPDGSSQITPWRIAFERYNDPERNAFRRR